MRKLKLLFAAIAVLAASPAFVRPYSPWLLDRPFYGPDSRIHISAARAAALRQCNASAEQWRDYEWGNMATFRYRACMNEHGQVE